MLLSSHTVEAILKQVKTPDGKGDILSSGVVTALHIGENSLRFVLDVPSHLVESYKPIRQDLENQLKQLEGASHVMVGLSAQAAMGNGNKTATPNHQTSSPPPPQMQKGHIPSPKPIQGVKHVIAIASGKGGVGKSTLTANLAVALAKKGKKIGLLDADIFGPSQAKMFALNQKPETAEDGHSLLPIEQYGIKLMSMGLMVEEGQAIVWRGPMLMKALEQMIHQIEWGELDILLIDLPPGTGDVQLSLAQKTTLSGAIIISTPQDIALIDARKAVDMFHRLHVPILGMVENMSTYICPQCGHEEAIFGHEGVRKEAQKMDVALLGQIPLHLNICQSGEKGMPVVMADANTPYAKAFMEVATKLEAMPFNKIKTML